MKVRKKCVRKCVRQGRAAGEPKVKARREKPARSAKYKIQNWGFGNYEKNPGMEEKIDRRDWAAIIQRRSVCRKQKRLFRSLWGDCAIDCFVARNVKSYLRVI